MNDTSSPINPRLRVRNLVRGLVALVAVIAIGAAFAAGHAALGIAGLAMLGVGIPAAWWVGRTRRFLTPGRKASDPPR